MENNNLKTRSDADILEQVETVVCSSDRTFFQQHPTRKYRIRPAWDVEIEDMSRHAGPLATPPAGICWWIVVRQLSPGVRGRFPFTAPHDLPPETSEKDARRIWRLVCSDEWQAGFDDLERAIPSTLRRVEDKQRT